MVLLDLKSICRPKYSPAFSNQRQLWCETSDELTCSTTSKDHQLIFCLPQSWFPQIIPLLPHRTCGYRTHHWQLPKNQQMTGQTEPIRQSDNQSMLWSMSTKSEWFTWQATWAMICGSTVFIRTSFATWVHDHLSPLWHLDKEDPSVLSFSKASVALGEIKMALEAWNREWVTM